MCCFMHFEGVISKWTAFINFIYMLLLLNDGGVDGRKWLRLLVLIRGD